MYIYIFGICGIFMGGFVVFVCEVGYMVMGCDVGVYLLMSMQFEVQGIMLIEGYGVEQIDLKLDLFVIGNVVMCGNLLMEVIFDCGLLYVLGLQWFGEYVLVGKWVFVVVGMYGKMIMLLMFVWLLEDVGFNLGFLIGGVLLNFGVFVWFIDLSFFVIEVDEYDMVFFDKCLKFVYYWLCIVVLNNFEFDYVDIFFDFVVIEM